MTSSSPNSTDLRAQVLIVEDEADHADVMADALKRPGHVCTIVNDVKSAIEELRGGAFDIVVTDLRMPNSSGYATGVADPTNPANASGTVASDGADAGLRVLDATTTPLRRPPAPKTSSSTPASRASSPAPRRCAAS